MDPSSIITWCQHTARLHPRLRRTLTQTAGASPATRFMAIQAEAKPVIFLEREAGDAEYFAAPSIILVGAECVRHGDDGHLKGLVRKVIEDGHRSFVPIFEPLTVEEAADLVRQVMRELEGTAHLGFVEDICARHIQDFSELYWVDEIVRDERLLSEILLDAAGGCSRPRSVIP